jgi:signal transduction histidine kinase
MQPLDHVRNALQQIRTVPLSWLSLSLRTRLLIVAISYGLGVPGLWFLFPLVHNGASMYLPIVAACWLFRYRGLLISLILNGIAFQLTYTFLLRGLLPTQDFVEGGLIGFGTSLALGLVVCWIRTAVDQVQVARQQALIAEQERMLAQEAERKAKLDYEYERKLNALKEQFLLNVNHELRTPLTVLAGSLEMLIAYQEHLSPSDRADLLKKAQESQEELVLLVDHVLDASSFMSELPVVNPEVVSLHNLLGQTLTALAPGDLAAYTLCLKVNEQIRVWADPQLLRQVLRNLIANICKYVPTHTEIRIEAMQAEASSSVYLSIQDAGPGIPVDELPLLFEKFVRLKRDLGGPMRGTGLGLYICKQMVEAMGGQIWAESSGKPGEGSRFCITLPSAALA